MRYIKLKHEKIEKIIKYLKNKNKDFVKINEVAKFLKKRCEIIITKIIEIDTAIWKTDTI